MFSTLKDIAQFPVIELGFYRGRVVRWLGSQDHAQSTEVIKRFKWSIPLQISSSLHAYSNSSMRRGLVVSLLRCSHFATLQMIREHPPTHL